MAKEISLEDLAIMINNMDQRIDNRFADMDKRIDRKFSGMDEKIDKKFMNVTERQDRIEDRLDNVPCKFELKALEKRVGALEG